MLTIQVKEDSIYRFYVDFSCQAMVMAQIGCDLKLNGEVLYHFNVTGTEGDVSRKELLSLEMPQGTYTVEIMHNEGLVQVQDITFEKH